MIYTEMFFASILLTLVVVAAILVMSSLIMVSAERREYKKRGMLNQFYEEMDMGRIFILTIVPLIFLLSVTAITYLNYFI